MRKRNKGKKREGRGTGEIWRQTLASWRSCLFPWALCSGWWRKPRSSHLPSTRAASLNLRWQLKLLPLDCDKPTQLQGRRLRHFAVNVTDFEWKAVGVIDSWFSLSPFCRSKEVVKKEKNINNMVTVIKGGKGRQTEMLSGSYWAGFVIFGVLLPLWMLMRQSILPWCQARFESAESLCPLEVVRDAVQGFLAVRRTLSDSNTFLRVLGRQQGGVQRGAALIPFRYTHTLLCRDKFTSWPHHVYLNQSSFGFEHW